MYRIISGSCKGRKIVAPKYFDVRPTTDFAKEGLFSIINHRYDFQDIKVLDLFAGIGSISLEFASRGCLSIESVEKNHKHARFIEETASKLFPDVNCINVVERDVYTYLKINPITVFDIIFADPPFNFQEDDYLSLIDIVCNNTWVSSRGVFIIEHSSKLSFENHSLFDNFKKYGSVGFSFFKY